MLPVSLGQVEQEWLPNTPDRACKAKRGITAFGVKTMNVRRAEEFPDCEAADTGFGTKPRASRTVTLC